MKVSTFKNISNFEQIMITLLKKYMKSLKGMMSFSYLAINGIVFGVFVVSLCVCHSEYGDRVLLFFIPTCLFVYNMLVLYGLYNNTSIQLRIIEVKGKWGLK